MTTLKELRETYHLKRAIFTNINDQFLYKIDTRIFAMDKKINDILYKLIETNIIFNKQLEYDRHMAMNKYTEAKTVAEYKEKKAIYTKITKEWRERLTTQKRTYNNRRIQLQKEKDYILKNVREMERAKLETAYTEMMDALHAWDDKKKENEARKSIKMLSKEKLEKETEDVCGICLETHKFKDIIQTNCKHQFGEECFTQWCNTCRRQRKSISCPMCKKKNPKIFRFKENKMYRFKDKFIMPNDNEESNIIE